MKLRCPVCRKWFEPVRRDAVTCSVRCRVARQRELQANTPPWPEGGPFDLVVIDLPLRWIGRSPKGEAKSPQAHYATMDIPAVIRQLKPMLAAVMAKRFTSCWWVYGPRLPDTLEVLTKTGSIYRGELLTWRKPGAFGLGKSTRKRFENMWYGAARAGGLPIHAHNVDQEVLAEDDLPFMIEAPRRGDSVKPDEAFAALERLYGDVRRLELYARKPRPGWTVWGMEVADLASTAAD